MDLTFYATLDASTLKPYLPDLPYLLPLASWWRQDVQLKRPPRLPRQLRHVAVDCGSYTLAQHQLEPGFHFTAEQYVSWVNALGPAVQWAVLPDWPCEGATAAEVRRRQMATTPTAVDVLSEHLDTSWCWCPVLQGQHVDHYLRHAIDIAGWIYDLHQVYANRGQAEAFRVCVGSLCRRNSVAEILSIVSHVAQVLPGLRLHLFGVKLAVLQQTGYLPDAVVSIDSAAWTSRFGKQIDVSADEQRRTCRRCRLVAPDAGAAYRTAALNVAVHLGNPARVRPARCLAPVQGATRTRTARKRPIAAWMGRVRLTCWGLAAADCISWAA